MKPILYVITSVWRDANLGQLAVSLRSLCEHFDLRWLPIFDCVNGNGDGAGKRNVALRMITEPGWIYHLDDDNLIHPNFGAVLQHAIATNAETKVFFFRVVRPNGQWWIAEPALIPGRIDTGCYVVHTSAAEGVWWDLAEMPTPDYFWIKRVIDKGHPPVLLDGLCYYNAMTNLPPGGAAP